MEASDVDVNAALELIQGILGDVSLETCKIVNTAQFFMWIYSICKK